MNTDEASAPSADGDQLGNLLSLWVVTFHDAIARSLGLNATEHKALDLIIYGTDVTPTQIATLMGLSGPALTKICARLVRQGYVERHRDAADGRRLILVPAPGLAARMAAVYEPFTERLGGLAETMSPVEQAAVTRWVREAIDGLRDATQRLKG